LDGVDDPAVAAPSATGGVIEDLTRGAGDCRAAPMGWNALFASAPCGDRAPMSGDQRICDRRRARLPGGKSANLSRHFRSRLSKADRRGARNPIAGDRGSPAFPMN
jgi:hypothetical protein